MRVPYNVRKRLEGQGELIILAIVCGNDKFAYEFGKELFQLARKAGIV